MPDGLAQPVTEVAPNLVELLRWIAERPRTYGDTMEAWRTSCPKLPAWEDAVDHELVRVEPIASGRQHQAAVLLTPRGELFMRQKASA